MTEYVRVDQYENTVRVIFYIEQDKPLAIGEKMNELDANAYMNGYNWEAFFQYYLAKHAPEILEDMDTDPEAGMYVAFYDLTPENEARAKKFSEIIRSLIEHEAELLRITREEGDRIGWE